MPLWQSPPHRVNSFAAASGADPGGGTALTYSPADTNLPCSIDTASAAEQEHFAQVQIVVTHTIGFLASAVTTPLVRGMKLVTADRGETFHVKGISAGRAYGNVPAFTYAFCEQLL